MLLPVGGYRRAHGQRVLFWVRQGQAQFFLQRARHDTAAHTATRHTLLNHMQGLALTCLCLPYPVTAEDVIAACRAEGIKALLALQH